MAAAPAPLIPNLTPNLWVDIKPLETLLIAARDQTQFPNEISKLVASFLKRVWFDEDACRKFFGKPNPVPELPANIDLILAQPNPFNPKNQVGDDFEFFLDPCSIIREEGGKQVDRPITLDTIKYFAENPLKGSKSQYKYYDEDIAALHGKTASKTSRYVLLSKTVIANGRGKSYDTQKKIMAEKGCGLYQVPSARSVAFLAFAYRLMTERQANPAGAGERLYSDDFNMMIYCAEELDNGCPLIVGDFAVDGLYVCYDDEDDDEDENKSCGVGPLREFPDIGN